MSQVFRACRKRYVEGREKPYFDETGLRLIIGEWRGKTTYAIGDNRTGELYSCFPIEKQGTPDRGQSRDSGPREAPPFTGSDVQF